MMSSLTVSLLQKKRRIHHIHALCLLYNVGPNYILSRFQCIITSLSDYVIQTSSYNVLMYMSQ